MSKPAAVYASIIVLQFVKHGFQLQPNFDVAVTTIALNPFQSFTDLPPGAQYVTSSWFMPAVLYFLRVSSETAMIWLHIAVALGYYVVTYLNVKRFVPDDSRLTAIVIIGLLPSTASAFNWLGYDTVILLLISLLIAASRSLILSFFVAVALGMQHFEIAVVSMLCWLIVSRGIATQSHLRAIKFIVTAGLGLAVGRITVAGILASDTSASMSDRLDVAQQIYRKALANFAVAPMAVLWSTIGVTSVYLIITLASRKVAPFWMLTGIIIPWIAAGTTLDSSRVGAVSVTLAIMATVFSSPHTLRAVPQYALSAMVVLFLLIPRVWTWEGAYEPSCFTANVHTLISQFRPVRTLIESNCRLYWTDS